MSLQLVAKHLASKGRGPDTTLVHMTPGEVSGLHALAKAGGTALTTNPDTGLPEAGVLSSLLPTLIGAGITAATGGAAAPWMIGAGVGGLQALRTGNIGQGLMAGLGAYGGAGLTGSLAGMGTGALSQQAGAAASQGLEGVAADQAAEQAIKGRLADASFMDKLKAGAGTFEWNKPMDFISGLGGGSKGKGIGMLAGAFGPAAMEFLQPSQSGMMQIAGDSTRAPGLVYTGGNQYRRMTPDEEAARKAKYGFAEGGLATGGVPEWNPEWNPDVPEYDDLGRDFGRERLYSEPPSTVPDLKKIAAAQEEIAAAGTGEGGAGGQDFGGGFRGVDPSTGLQGQGFSGQTGLYGDAAAGTGQSTASGSGGYSVDSGGGYSPGTSGSDSRESSTAEREANGGMVGRYADGGVTGQGGLNLHVPLSIGGGGGGGAQTPGGYGAIGGGGGGSSSGFMPLPPPQAPLSTGFSQSRPQPQPQPEQEPMPFVSNGRFLPTPINAVSPRKDLTPDGFPMMRTLGPESLVEHYKNIGLRERGLFTGGEGLLNRSGGGERGFFADGGITGYAQGGIGSLGSYSDGGRLLRGPGDGVSDHIPATIGTAKQPARLADGEFVVPARIVSELGNGSTEAGARALYAMMDRIQKNRRKTVGKGKVAVNSKSTRLLPA